MNIDDPLQQLRPAWHHDAACHDSWQTMYSDEPADQNKARRICARCNVRSNCLATALTQREQFGMWGGLTATERQEVLTTTAEEIPRLLAKIVQRQRSSRLAAS